MKEEQGKGIREIAGSGYGFAVTGALIGVVIFVLLYGIATLIPTNVSFIYDSDDKDVVSHQLGFDFYRSSSWQHPLGLTDAYPYPYESSVINSDSIPLLAVPFKLVSPFLPVFFQYFGFWIFFCFVMQGGAAALLLRKLKLDYWAMAASVPLFIINVPLLFRCFHHSSLAAQWVILVCFILFLEMHELGIKKQAAAWCLLCGLTVWIHGYLFIITGTLMTMFCVLKFTKEKKIKDVALIFVPCVIATLFCYYEGGGFISYTSVEMHGLGLYTLDLTDFINPASFSTFLTGMEGIVTSETVSYLGAGVVLLIVAAMASVLKNREPAAGLIKEKRTEIVCILVFCLVFLVMSMSVCGKFLGINIYDLRNILGEKILVFLSGFRASARFI